MLEDADTLDRHLGPAAGCGAEIDQPGAGFQDLELIVELQQLEGSARAIAETLGLGHIGVIQLTLQPAGRRDRALGGGLDAGMQAAAARPCRFFLVAHGGVPLASARIIDNRIPSRTPRSATRSDPVGHN